MKSYVKRTVTKFKKSYNTFIRKRNNQPTNKSSTASNKNTKKYEANKGCGCKNT